MWRGRRRFEHCPMTRSAASALILALVVSTVAIGSADPATASVDPATASVEAATASVEAARPRAVTGEPARDRSIDRAALEALLAGDDADALDVSDDFVRRFGYAPRWNESMAVHPDGSCSSPVPLPDEFRSPCAAHDFGYDLLREVVPTSRAARLGLDARLVGRLDERCDRGAPPTGTHWGCRILVGSISRGLAVNTWRQDDEPPLEESVSDILSSLVRKVVTT